jgi:hypothetical protein
MRLGVARACRRLSRDLVQSWNRITAGRMELTHRRLEPERLALLRARLHELEDAQDQLEADMTALAARWVELVGEGAPTPRRATAERVA